MEPNTPVFSGSRPFKPLVVLVADGDADARAELCQELEFLGHVVVAVDSGNAAIRVLKSETVDLVVTEVIMANGDGLELILELRRLQPTARVVAVSGGGRYLPAEDCLRVAKGLGAHDTLLKPIQREQLSAVLDRLTGEALASRG